MPAITATQATIVMPATSNIKNDSIIMTAHNSRKARNSRNESNERTANTVLTSKSRDACTNGAGYSREREANSNRNNRNR
jgi:hypothetical protein